MYFQITEGIFEIDRKDIKSDTLAVGIITLEELEKNYEELGFSEATVQDCKNESHSHHGNLETYHDYSFGIIYGINAMQIIKVQDRIGIYIKSNLLLIVIIEDKDDSTILKLYELLDRLNLTKINLERLIYGFLERLVSDDYDLLQRIEAEISEHEDKINERNLDKNFNNQITEIRKKLMFLDNYYQQLIALGEELEENSADIFLEENLHYFKKYTDRVTRLSNNTRMLQDYSVHVREAYHAQLEYDLNKIMKLFTVVTTIFLPLTLIVGWYGMNFTTMPELTWRYGYLFVILLSIIIAIICLIFFKKKKFM
jgi:magnesium transporter